MKKVVVVTASDRLAELEETYTMILGASMKEEVRSWRLSEPVSNTSGGPIIELVEAVSEEDLSLVKENGGVAGVKEISLVCDRTNQQSERIEVAFNGRCVRINLETE